MDRGKISSRITTTDLDLAWKALDEENSEPTIPKGAQTIDQLMTRWGTSYERAGRRATKMFKAGKMLKAKILQGGRRISVYWPK